MITSSSTRDYVVSLPDGSTYTRSYQWRQTITFQSCQHDESPRDVKPTQMLSVDQVFVLYDANNELVRFAMSNKIGDINGELTEIIFVFLFLVSASFLERNINPDQGQVYLLLVVLKSFSCEITPRYTFCFQGSSQRRIRVSPDDTAVTPTLFAEVDRETSSPVSVLLASTVMAKHVTVRTTEWKRSNKGLLFSLFMAIKRV